MKHIEFMPASMALLLWSASVVNMIGFSLWQWVTHRNHVGSLYRPAGWSLNGILINWLALTVSMFFVMTVPIYFGIQHMRNLLKLEEQMTSFSIKASERLARLKTQFELHLFDDWLCFGSILRAKIFNRLCTLKSFRRPIKATTL